MSWHENCDNFDSRVEASAKDANFNDTDFLLIQADAEDPGGDKVSANKAILALISPVFYAQFYGPLSSNQPPPPIQDGTARGFKQFIKFICNPISFKFPENNVLEVFEISYFAHKYQIGSLVSHCRQQLGMFYMEGKEVEILNWALSTEHGSSLKETLTPEYELLVNRCFTQIEKNFEKIFPNGKIIDGQELLEENVMVRILGKKEMDTEETFVLLVALDYFEKLVGNGQNGYNEKKLRIDYEDAWNKKLVTIKSIISLGKVSPKKFAELFDKVSDTIPPKIMCDITKSISTSWKEQEPSDNAGKRTRYGWDVIIEFDCNSDDWMHDDHLLMHNTTDKAETTGAQITFRTSQNAILHFHNVSMLDMVCRRSYKPSQCQKDKLIFKTEGNYKEEVALRRSKDSPDTEYSFYVEANKKVSFSYERKCKKESKSKLSCPLHLHRMEKFHFSKGIFELEILEINGMKASSDPQDDSYSFISFLGFTPL